MIGSPMVDLDRAITAYYERGEEAGRLEGGMATGPLELARTKELVRRHLPDRAPLRVLDVGGGPGVHARWLAGLGHQVHVVDPVPLHVRQARAADPRVTAELGDARALSQAAGSVDVVLLFGSQYHLTERAERLRAVSEARRVLVPGGQVFVAAIGRLTALMELLLRADRLDEPTVAERVLESVRTGVFRGSADDELFTTAYFHLPDELLEELDAAGFPGARVYGVEGPGFLAADIADRWADPDRRASLLRVAREVESEAMLQGAGHLLAVGSRAG
jgi:SAM-dependent methyltransferase